MNTPYLRALWLMMVWLATCSLAYASTPAPTVAGHIAFISGQVILSNGNQASRQAQTGDPVYVGDHIQTQANAHLHLRMVDNAFVALRPDSQLTIRTYSYDKDQPQASRIRMDLQQGTSRAVTGKGGQAAKHQYRFNTPLAAIGLRGTDYTVTTEADKTRISVAQGGIIVSPLGGDCQSAQLGPCNTPFSRVLTAEMRNTVIEITPSHPPKLLTQPAPGQTSNGSSKIDTLPETTVAKVHMDQVIDRATKAVGQPAGDTGVNTQSIQERPQTLARWGRWSALVQELPQGSGTINQVFSQMKDYQIVATNDAFALAYPAQASITPPTHGKVQFELVAAEAYTQNKGQTQVATVKTGQLEMDFAQKTFKTQLAVITAPTGLESLKAQGSLDSYGRLQSNTASSDTHIRGVLLNQGQEATYLFDKNLQNGVTLTGAAQWAR